MTFAHAWSAHSNVHLADVHAAFAQALSPHSKEHERPPVHLVAAHPLAAHTIAQSVPAGHEISLPAQPSAHANTQPPFAHVPPAAAHVAGVHAASVLVGASVEASGAVASARAVSPPVSLTPPSFSGTSSP